MKHYKFIPCNGVKPEGKCEDEISVRISGGYRTIRKYSSGWAWSNSMPIDKSDWYEMEILVEVPGVPMTREQIEDLVVSCSGKTAIEINYIIANLFKPQP